MNKEETNALRNMKKSKDINIVREDKGNSTVVLDTLKNNKKIPEHLPTEGSCKIIDKDRGNKILREAEVSS